MNLDKIRVDFKSDAVWESPDQKHRGVFRPNPGIPALHGTRLNPEKWSSKLTHSARLYVGFNVGLKKKYTLRNLVDLVKRVRTRHVGLPDSSFLSQEGIYTYQKGPLTGKYTEEPGAQIVILNVYPVEIPKNVFRESIQDLAERICEELTQEEVIVDFQTNGVVKETVGYEPRPKGERSKQIPNYREWIDS